MARWLESLAEYEFTVQHRPGKKHTNADACLAYPARMPPSMPTAYLWTQLTKREICELQSRDEGIEQVIEWVENQNQRKDISGDKLL